MNYLRKCWWTKLLVGFLALHILNLSVDSPDGQPYFVAEDLSINDQESFVELVVEKILGFDDAFAEFDDPDSSNINVKLILSFPLLAQAFLFTPFIHYFQLVAGHHVTSRSWQIPALSNLGPPPKC
ncbi:hypothetical protein [Dyadobacter crusticola]|uniref:hypothetical protein n=1 Tax=Dyadobacter crusticola TaxID=292407 RepID=UPI00068939A7|nr:hypothetical protein [Dyadobacter crusticola]